MAQVVLVVDDDSALRFACVEALKNEGYQVLNASSGEEATNLIDKYKVDMVLTDYQMGKVSGLDVLKYAKSTHPKCEVIVMTAYATYDLAREVLRNQKGASFLCKPIQVAELRDLVRKCLQKNEIKKNIEETKDNARNIK
ncbi:MAG: response regulator [Elusimicrobia bacterium]|nr:response regulator [Candidatus Liberimonas magnetica]